MIFTNSQSVELDPQFNSALIRVKEDSLKESLVPSLRNIFTDGITAASILDGQVLTSLTIATEGYIQSANYEAGVTGWKLTATTAYLPDLDLSGYLLATGGKYKTADSGARVEIFPDANTGIVAYDSASSEVFKVLVGGANEGDVTLGDYANNKGVQWDKSVGTFTVKGALVTGSGSTINGTYVDSLSVEKLTAGTITSQAITLGFTNEQGDCYIASTGFDATNWRGNGVVALGIDDSDNNYAKFFAGNYSTHKYIRWDGNRLVVTGAIINLYLADGHDGDIVCNGTIEPASMTKSGNTYTLNQDLYCNNLTVSSGITLKPNGYAIYVLENFTNSGAIECDGAVGGEGDIGTYQRSGDPYRSDGGVGGIGGGSIGSTFGRALSGANGGYSEVAYTAPDQVDTDGVAGTSKNPSLGSSGVAGGNGANLYYSTNLTYYGTHMHGGAAGVATEELLKLGEPQDTYVGSGGGSTHDIFLALRMVAYGVSSGKTLSHSASSGGGGAGLGRYAVEDWGDGTAHRMHTGGGGGGGGGNAGIILIAARNFINYGTITCNGGAGGKGGNSVSAGGWLTGVGGGGGGGTGGIIIIMRGATWTQGTISASGGTGGVHGNGNAGEVPGNEATDGANGKAGKIYYFVIR